MCQDTWPSQDRVLRSASAMVTASANLPRPAGRARKSGSLTAERGPGPKCPEGTIGCQEEQNAADAGVGASERSSWRGLQLPTRRAGHQPAALARRLDEVAAAQAVGAIVVRVIWVSNAPASAPCRKADPLGCRRRGRLRSFGGRGRRRHNLGFRDRALPHRHHMGDWFSRHRVGRPGRELRCRGGRRR